MIITNQFAGDCSTIQKIIPTDFNLTLNWINARIPDLNARIQIKLFMHTQPGFSRIDKLFVAQARTDQMLACYENDEWKVTPNEQLLDIIQQIAIAADKSDILLKNITH